MSGAMPGLTQLHGGSRCQVLLDLTQPWSRSRWAWARTRQDLGQDQAGPGPGPGRTWTRTRQDLALGQVLVGYMTSFIGEPKYQRFEVRTKYLNRFSMLSMLRWKMTPRKYSS